MKRDKIWTILQIIALCVMAISECLVLALVIQLNVLPEKFLAVLIAALIVTLLYMTLFMFVRIRAYVAMWRKIVSFILAVVVACGCILASKVALDAYQLVNGITNNTTDVRNTYVLVLNEDPALSLSDTKDYRYAALENYDIEHTEQMIHTIQNETKMSDIAIKYYSTVSEMVNALYNKQVDAIIMNGASISLLTEQEDYKDFLIRVRLLYTLPYATDSDDNTVDFSTKTPFIVYISGSDTRSSKLEIGRSDVNILAVVNPVTKQILLINTPRDYYVPNPAGNGILDKLTHCSNYGVDCSVEALEGLYQTNISYYARINFVGFEALIDAIDGVTIYSEERFMANGRSFIDYGENHLMGQAALDYSRDRYHVSGGDRTRGNNQMKVLTAVINKMTSSSTLISNYGAIMKSLEGMFATSFQNDEISELVKMQLSEMPKWDIQSYAVSGSGDYQETYSWPGEKLWVMQPDMKTVEYARELVQRVLDGELLTAEDMKMPK